MDKIIWVRENGLDFKELLVYQIKIKKKTLEKNIMIMF